MVGFECAISLCREFTIDIYKIRTSYALIAKALEDNKQI